MKNISKSLNSIFGGISKWTNKENIKLRNNKISLNDAVYYRFLYSQINKTKEQISSSINFDNKCTIRRTSYDRKENNISINLYIKLLNEIRNFYNKNCDYNNALVISVDGTFNNTNINKFDKTLETSLNMGFYDTTNDLPFDLQFTGPNKKNTEIEQLKKYIEEKNLKDAVIVADRAYFKYELFDYLNNKNLGYVIRIKDNSYLINDNNTQPKKYANKYLIDSLKNNNNVRIIKCEYKGTKELVSKKNKRLKIEQTSSYNLITNLGDINIYTEEKIKEIYNSRWKVELFFKFLKSNFKFSHLAEKKEEQYKKLILIELILTYLCKILKFHYMKDNKKSSCIIKRKTKEIIETKFNINETNLLGGIYDKILKDLLYGKLKESTLVNLMQSYIVDVKNEPNRQFPRICKCPFKKWYVKMYHDFYKYDKINKKLNGESSDELDKNLKLKDTNS